MPQIENRQAFLLLVVLLVALPAQYLITHTSITPDSWGRRIAFERLLSTATGFRNRYLSLTAWGQWCQNILGALGGEGDDDPNGESPALEVLQYNNINNNGGYFGLSQEPRTFRPANVKYRVGQVVNNVHYNYRGVIIGWDVKARVSKDFMEQNYPPGQKYRLDMPHYAILMDTRQHLMPQVAYVPQESLEVIDKIRILHPKVEHYFESYHHGQYIPRPWLQSVYPED